MGKLTALAAPGAVACLYHLRHPAPKRSSRPARPRPPGRRKAGPQGWQRRFLRGPAVRKAPKAWRDGSRRRLSPERLEDHAALLVVQSVAAGRAHRPTAWLALVMYYLDVHRPVGASRRDARDNVLQLAAVLAVSADWRSGRRSRPGRQVAAGLLGLAERTITRHLAVLERHGLAERQHEGELLTAEARAVARADEDVSPDQQQRWTNRAEWTLLIPAWVREITDEQLAPYLQRAAALLDELAAPARRRPVDNPEAPAVDNPAGRAGNFGTVTPSRFLELLGSLPLRRGFLSLPVAVDGSAPTETAAEQEKGHTGGATRPSPTKSVPKTNRRMDPWAVRLARQLAADGRLPLGAHPHLPGVVSVLKKRVKPIWTVDDVVAEAHQRLCEARKTMVAQPDRPISYLNWLLASAVPDEPPAQIAAAALAAVREQLVERATRWQRQAAAGEAGRHGPGIQEAQRVLKAIGERRRQERHSPEQR